MANVLGKHLQRHAAGATIPVKKQGFVPESIFTREFTHSRTAILSSTSMTSVDPALPKFQGSNCFLNTSQEFVASLEKLSFSSLLVCAFGSVCSNISISFYIILYLYIYISLSIFLYIYNTIYTKQYHRLKPWNFPSSLPEGRQRQMVPPN